MISAGVLDKADYPDFDEETGILTKEDDSGNTLWLFIERNFVLIALKVEYHFSFSFACYFYRMNFSSDLNLKALNFFDTISNFFWHKANILCFATTPQYILCST